MEPTLWNKALRLTMAVVTPVAITLVSCGQPGGRPSPPPGGPQFVINSPQAGSQIAGPTFFSVQPLNPSRVQSVRFEVEGNELKPVFPGEDMFKVFLLPSDFPAGELALEAHVSGKDGRISSRTITVTNVPNPPSQATVGAKGAVLGTREANGAVSTLTIPPGVAQGTHVSFEARTQEEVKASTGVDYDALGVTFLGAQEIGSDRPLEQALMVSSGGFGPMVQPGQAVVNYMIAPDADGDGIGELVVINTASVAPNGDVVSDPAPQLQLGNTVTVSTPVSAQGTSSLRTLQAPLLLAPGDTLIVQARGFNPYATPLAVFTTSTGSTTDTVEVRATFQVADGSLNLVVTVPHLSEGPAELFFYQPGDLVLSQKYEIRIEAPVLEPTPPEDILLDEDLLEQVIEVLGSAPAADAQLKELLESAKRALEDFKEAFQRELLGDPDLDLPPPLEDDQLAGLASLFLALEAMTFDDLPDTECFTSKHWDSLGDIASKLGSLASSLVATRQTFGPALELANLLARAAAAIEIFRNAARDDGCPEDPPPPLPPCPPSAGGGGGGTTTGMGSAIPPGGNGCGTVSGGGLGSSNLRTLQAGPFGMEPGRYAVIVLVRGLPLAFSGTTDAAGYFFIPLIPRNEPFTAIAVDTVTGENRTFEGVGPALGESVFMFFDFLSEDDDSGIPRLELNSNTQGTLAEGVMDRYVFNGFAGQHVNVALHHGIDSNPSVWAFDPSGNRIGFGGTSNDLPYGETGVLTLTATGMYIVEAGGFGSAVPPVGDYTLGLALIEEPVSITPTSPSMTLSGDLAILGDHEFYSFSGTAGEVHIFILSHPDSSRLRAHLQVRSPGQQPFYQRPVIVSRFTSSSRRSVASGDVTLPETGEYVIEVSTYRGTSRPSFDEHTGAFELTLETP